MRSILFMALGLLAAWQCGSTQTTEVKKADTAKSVNGSDLASNTTAKTGTDQIKYLDGADARVFENFTEGWSTPEKAQVLISQTLSDTSKGDPVANARQRLASVILQDNYNLGREYLTISAKVVKSKVFQALGKEQVHKKQENDKITVILLREGKDLKKSWLTSLMQLEKEVPELAKKRK